jgi:hypothetical protein
MKNKIKGLPHTHLLGWQDSEGNVWERGSTCVSKKFENFFFY